MKIGINIKGLSELSAQIKILGSAAELAVEEIVEDVAINTHSIAVKGIASQPASGKIYGKHQASAAGQFPMTDTGFLASNVKFEFRTKQNAIVGTDVKYGKNLEFGMSRVAARPWLGRSFNQAIEKARGKLKRSFEANR